jgi:N-acetylmuramic acid 6-phosphate etherase
MKAGTAQKMILNMLSTGAMIRLGKVYGNLMVDVKASNKKLEARAKRIVRTATGCDQAEAAQALEQSGGCARQAIDLLRGKYDK